MRRRRITPSSLFFIAGTCFNARFAGDSGASGGDDSALQAKIDAAVEKATAPLKANRDEILNEKRKLKEQYDSLNDQIGTLGGADGLKNLIEMRERFSKDELGKLLTEGKHDEWYERRSVAMRKDMESKIAAATKLASDASAERDVARVAYSNKEIETSVLNASSKAGIVDTAIDDVLLRAKSTFTFDPKLGVVIKDADGVIINGKDGKTPKGVVEWLDEMKEKARHWFPPSRGSGAEGGMGGGSNSTVSNAAIANMSMTEYKEYRKKQGMTSGWAGNVSN